jgi:hypothetical protein
MVSVAVALPFTVGAEGLTLHVMLLDEGVHVNVTTPLKLPRDARFSATVPELPDFTVICGTCGASVKSPGNCVTERLATLLAEGM